MSVLLGHNLLVIMNGTAIAASKSCQITRNCDAKEISSPSSAQARDYIAGRTGWRVTVNILGGVGIEDKLLDVGSVVTLRFKERNRTSYTEGSALITQFDVVATEGNISTGTFSFLGKGELTAVTPT